MFRAFIYNFIYSHNSLSLCLAPCMPRVDTDFGLKSAAGGVQGAKHDQKHMITHLHQQLYMIYIYGLCDMMV
ncbi:unnamed protein product [Arabidopsis halleri]